MGRPLGRHFLRPADAHAIVDAAGIRPGELVLDLGAGDGALTEPLRQAGARVVAVEVDRRALARLHERFSDDDQVTIVDGDLLRVPLPRRPYRVVANLPFATTSAALRRLLDPRGNLKRADLVVQRGAAVRWAQQRPRRFHLHVERTVRRSSFVPPPGVDGAVLVVTRHR